MFCCFSSFRSNLTKPNKKKKMTPLFYAISQHPNQKKTPHPFAVFDISQQPKPKRVNRGIPTRFFRGTPHTAWSAPYEFPSSPGEKDHEISLRIHHTISRSSYRSHTQEARWIPGSGLLGRPHRQPRSVMQPDHHSFHFHQKPES